jgi:hypothetical protein
MAGAKSEWIPTDAYYDSKRRVYYPMRWDPEDRRILIIDHPGFRDRAKAIEFARAYRWPAEKAAAKRNPRVRLYRVAMSNWRAGDVPETGDVLRVGPHDDYRLVRGGMRHGKRGTAPRAYLPPGEYHVVQSGWDATYVTVQPIRYSATPLRNTGRKRRGASAYPPF